MSRRIDLRHPLAALIGVGGLVLGSVALVAGPAFAAEELVGTTTFDCTSEAAPGAPFSWDGTFTLTATRPDAASTAVVIAAEVSDMAGLVPVPLGEQSITAQLALDVAGTAATLTGTGTSDIPADTEFPLPAMQGPVTSAATDLAITVTAFEFELTDLESNTTCVVDTGAALGDLTVVVGEPPPTEEPEPSESPTPSASPTDDADGKGKPAKGKVTFDCVLNPLGSDFEYPATITVAGYRADAGDPVSLSAEMTDIPGIAPVLIDGQMDVTLDLTVGGKKTTLEGGGHVTAPAHEKVSVPTLTGKVAASGDELDVKATAFTFNFAAVSVDADCETTNGSLGKMLVGTEPIDNDTGSLPRTGGGDAMPVIALWALAFVLLGAAGLLCVPTARRQH